MARTNRRRFLKLCLESASALALADRAGAIEHARSSTNQNIWRTPASIDKYIDPLPVPRQLEPIGKRGNTTLYRVRMMEFSKQLHSQLPPTKLWGYEGQFPGPIFEALQGKPIEVRWENHLPAQHIFPIDPQISHASGTRSQNGPASSWLPNSLAK